MQTSLFRPYSLGIVAEHKALHSKEISVTPHERLSYLDGEIKENVNSTEFKGVGKDDLVYEGKINTDNTVSATWLPMDSNRVTAPHVRRGERVMLYQMGEDTTTLYWRPLGLDDHLRKLETVVLAISANPDTSSDKLDLNNCYFLEVSSHMKHLVLSTSQAHGEPYAYLMKLDLGKGKFELKDHTNNQFVLNSAERQLLVKNADGAYIDVNKKNIKANAPDSFLAEAGSMIQLKTGGTVLTLTPGGTTLITPDFQADKG